MALVDIAPAFQPGVPVLESPAPAGPDDVALRWSVQTTGSLVPADASRGAQRGTPMTSALIAFKRVFITSGLDPDRCQSKKFPRPAVPCPAVFPVHSLVAK